MLLIGNSKKATLFALAGFCTLLAAKTGLAGDERLTAQELAGATYQGIEEGPVTLVDGRWEGEPYVEGGASRPSVGLVEDFVLSGDLDGNGLDESIVLIWQSSGGSGTFSYLAVMARQGDDVVSLGTAEIGDRVKVRKGRVDGELIVLDVLQQGEGDAACCPTQLATRSWLMVDGQLVESDMKVTGTLSLEILDGSEWVLALMDGDEILPEKAEVTLSFAEGRISGKSACNRYSASVEQGEAPGELKIGQAMGTRMACPENLMHLEQKYLDALSRVTDFSFLTGRLLLSWKDEKTSGSMVFDPR